MLKTVVYAGHMSHYVLFLLQSQSDHTVAANSEAQEEPASWIPEKNIMGDARLESMWLAAWKLSPSNALFGSKEVPEPEGLWMRLKN